MALPGSGRTLFQSPLLARPARRSSARTRQPRSSARCRLVSHSLFGFPESVPIHSRAAPLPLSAVFQPASGPRADSFCLLSLQAWARRPPSWSPRATSSRPRFACCAPPCCFGQLAVFLAACAAGRLSLPCFVAFLNPCRHCANRRCLVPVAAESADPCVVAWCDSRPSCCRTPRQRSRRSRAARASRPPLSYAPALLEAEACPIVRLRVPELPCLPCAVRCVHCVHCVLCAVFAPRCMQAAASMHRLLLNRHKSNPC